MQTHCQSVLECPDFSTLCFLYFERSSKPGHWIPPPPSISIKPLTMNPMNNQWSPVSHHVRLFLYVPLCPSNGLLSFLKRQLSRTSVLCREIKNFWNESEVACVSSFGGLTLVGLTVVGIGLLTSAIRTSWERGGQIIAAGFVYSRHCVRSTRFR